MYRKLQRAASVAAITAASLGGAQAAQAAVVVNVPCSATALAGAVNSANSGDTLSLAHRCVYRQADLPAISHDLAITGNGATLKEGSGVEVDAGTLTVSNLNFRKSGIDVELQGNVTVNGGSFTGNQDQEAIYDNSLTGVLTVHGATFTGNDGAIYDHGVYGAQVSDSVFHGNQGSVIICDSDTITTLSDIQVYGNSGNAIYDNTIMEIDNSQIYGNHGASKGGGIYISEPALAYVDGTTVRNNSAVDGGGIYNDAGTMYISGTIANNHASGSGGGIFNHTDDEAPNLGYVNLTNSNITGNVATTNGGAINNEGQLTAANTTILRNKAITGGGGIYDNGPDAAVTLSTSLVLGNRPDNCEPANSIAGCTR